MSRALPAALLLAALAACASPGPAPPAGAPGAGGPAAAWPIPLPDPPPPFWTGAEAALLDGGLEVLNCTRADLGFQKRPIDDPFRLPVVDRALDDPLSVGTEADAWDRVARGGDPSAILERARLALDLRDEPPAPDAGGPPAEPGDGGLRGRAAGLAADLVRALRDPAGVRGGLAPAGEKAGALLERMRLSQREEKEAAASPPALSQEEFLALARGIDLARIAAVGRDALWRTAALVAALRDPAPDGEAWRGRRAGGGLVVYGVGDDVHEPDRDAVLVIDLGGNDTWTRGAAAAALQGRPVAVAVDLSGNDRYVGREDLSFGAALGGVAIQWDGGGDDLYDAGHASLGAGIGGVGVLVDEGGDDVYRCRDFGIGAGAFGVGLLLDRGGNDLYHADLYGEGFASVRGCGVLADLAGNDVYDAGGVHLHAPLYADRHQSLSQGFAIGMRPDASGGVGVLVDAKGNDRYAADIYGQGASYWYSLGVLVDDDGNDTYALGQYGQGSGIHLSAGVLVDRAGSDLYYLKNGVGMGGAHDYAVGVLVDRGGDDYYAGSGGTQGGALTNSVALLLDGGGNDGYAAVVEGSQGYASPARGTGGIALLLDAGGKDVYTERDRDGAAWTKEILGAGLDEPSPPAEGGVGDPGTTAMTPEEAKGVVDRDGTVPGPDGKPVDDLDRLWKVASEWEVGDYRVIVPIARERLVALGTPALDRALERIGDRHGLEFRACEHVFAKLPREEVVPRLLGKTRDPDVSARRGAVRALAGLRAAEAAGRFEELLEDPEVRGAALGALAALKAAPPAVRGLLRAEREGVAVAAANCLAAVGDGEAVAALSAALGPDHAFPVRLAAMDRLAAMGEKAVPALAALAADGGAPTMARRNALRALGRTKRAEAAGPVRAALGDGDRLLRLSAFQAAGDLARALGDSKEAADRERGRELAAALAAAREGEADPLVRRMR